MTPFGRIAIIKSLALPKLTQIALICPVNDGKLIKELELLTYTFLWRGKPYRINREDSFLPLVKGGLKMLNIYEFWDSLKLSWIRRLMTSNGAWQKILQLNLLYIGYETKDIWFGGPSLIEKIAEKFIKWKEIHFHPHRR